MRPMSDPKFINVIDQVREYVKQNPTLLINDTEQFGRLLIQECCRVLESNGYDDASNSLKEHYGTTS